MFGINANQWSTVFEDQIEHSLTNCMSSGLPTKAHSRIVIEFQTSKKMQKSNKNNTKGEAGILPALEQQNKHGHTALLETEDSLMFTASLQLNLDMSVLCITCYPNCICKRATETF